MKKAIPMEIKNMVRDVTENAVKTLGEVDLEAIAKTLEGRYRVRFVSMSTLDNLVREALEDIIYIEI